jgi:hypothetical protein
VGRRYGQERRAAEITYAEEENDHGRKTPCVYATCEKSGDEVGPIWGDGDASVHRALATLTDECGCGARFHYEAD